MAILLIASRDARRETRDLYEQEVDFFAPLASRFDASTLSFSHYASRVTRLD
jgi:hypothetical protein